ncbi:alpha/beta hydrolase family protein [Bryocella elongata]|uniref:alpha/beta hydrolase family protein n=1 Tax=Bryocella elongata TaxID=863522 RepID=UPI000CDF0FAE|nr:hypothetical protein [Bryocella elongata]
MILPLAAILLLAAASLAYASRRFSLPEPTGPYPVGTRILYLNEPGRALDGTPDPQGTRPLVVQIWYPAVPSAAPIANARRLKETTWRDAYLAAVPTHSRWNAPVAVTHEPLRVLLFSPRWRGERTQNTIAFEELASHGYVVAAVDHPLNAERMELADGTVVYGSQQLQGPYGNQATAQQQISYWNEQLYIWAADMRATLDKLSALNDDPRDPLHARLDTQHVGAWGHSFGGAAALQLCGLDPRVVAAVNLDGWSFAGLDQRNADQRIMLVYEDVSRQRELDLSAQPALRGTEDRMDRLDFQLTRDSLEHYGGLRVFVEGTQHADFSDQPILPQIENGKMTGPIDPQRSQQVLRALLLGFFDESLRGKPSPLLSPGQGQFPEVRVERWATPAASR